MRVSGLYKKGNDVQAHDSSYVCGEFETKMTFSFDYEPEPEDDYLEIILHWLQELEGMDLDEARAELQEI